MKPNVAVDSNQAAIIEIGLVVAGPFDSIDRRAIALAMTKFEQFVREHLPDFQFQLSRVLRSELSGDSRVEPSLLLQQAVEDRDARHWDFAFVVTAAELAGKYSPFCFAALSRPLDAAVFSLSLIDPQASGAEVDEGVRVERIACRLCRLMLHALGHHLGLPRSDQRDNFLFHPALADDVDQMETFEPDQLERILVALTEIADQRLEEGSGKRLSYPIFVLRAAWINRREIVEAVYAARPWEFPRRLSRLTIASVSTLAVLFLTAEAWDLGLSQSIRSIGLLAALSLIVTTLYVVARQQLLVRRGRHVSEQTVVTSTSALVIVLVGMIITWLSLFAIGATAGVVFYRPELVANWASSAGIDRSQIGFATTLQMSSFSASLGVLIGALGASFESQNYFRHVIFVDEEI